ncbi:hypothetical protein NUW58_g4451 [Xylaria curta]|uniref:Uncharacterized protein n=1 Tax=Xylaria curta TaxID=42375 RepID=A0ACC1P6F3_9PEZI|nr:hypothetical protein NUW58_g4451 [Xylaria curta]
MSSSGPHFDEDGHCYYLINGQHVWGTSNRHNPSSKSGSDRAIAHSVASEFRSRRFPSRSRTSPRTPPPSDMKKRMKTGFPPRFEAGRYEGSAPASPGNDYYRDGLEVEKNRHGPPLDSDYARRCNNYHDLDFAAQASEIEYKEHNKTAGKYSYRTRIASPGVYEGTPWETEDWHQRAAGYADRTRTLFHQ